jgi:hypothetical protein
VAAAAAVVGWGWYVVASFRTQQFGFSAAVLGVAAVFVLPVAVLPFVGLRWRAAGLGTGAVVLASLASAEAFAVLDEARFYREHRGRPAGAAVVCQDRQWPFSHHYMSFDPATGQWRGGD